MQKYLINTAHMNDRTANVVMTAVLFTYMIMQPIFGIFSDRFGRKTSMLLFGGLATLCTVPLMYAIADVKSPLAAYGLIIVALAIVSFYTSISGLVKSEMFRRGSRDERRSSRMRIANAIVGGSAEYVALWFKNSGAESNFLWYVYFYVRHRSCRLDPDAGSED
jgi:Major Facilitator Superfamily.